MIFMILLLHSASSLHIRIGTRPSPLACTMADAVASALRVAEPSITCEVVRISSSGDQSSGSIAATTLAQGKVVDFTGLLDDAVLNGQVDVAVHSLKDVPPLQRWTPGLTIGYHSPRETPYDMLIGASSLAELPANARVGSASVRRQAQRLSQRPDATKVNLRGNVQARLEALDRGTVDALLLAKAGLDRLGLTSSRGEHHELGEMRELPAEQMLPACGQGIVGAVCRSDRTEVLSVLRAADDRASRVAASAELSFLGALDGAAPWDGRPPLAAYMRREEDGGGWLLSCLLARPDGVRVLRTTRRAGSGCSEEEARAIGVEAGKELRAGAGADFFGWCSATDVPRVSSRGSPVAS